MAAAVLRHAASRVPSGSENRVIELWHILFSFEDGLYSHCTVFEGYFACVLGDLLVDRVEGGEGNEGGAEERDRLVEEEGLLGASMRIGLMIGT